MPNIKSAKKKLRQDLKKEKDNKTYKKTVAKTVKNMAKMKNTKELSKSYSSIDKAAKKGVIHKNKAARLKSRVSRLANKK
jgi:small subunit ribosomal protein S20